MIKIFVFGSNLLGVHGTGSALHAKKHYGAVDKFGVGLCGNSYAIPTKFSPRPGDSLPISIIEMYINQFLNFARQNPNLEFDVVAIGCGHAGFTPEHIAPAFKNYTFNVNLCIR